MSIRQRTAGVERGLLVSMTRVTAEAGWRHSRAATSISFARAAPWLRVMSQRRRA